MVELGIAILELDSSLEIFMSFLEQLLVQLYIAPVEVIASVHGVHTDCMFVFYERALHFTLMIQSQTEVLVIKRQIFIRSSFLLFFVFLPLRLEFNRFLVGDKGVFIPHHLEVRRPRLLW